MRALITGASGFVGRYLSSHLEEAGDTVIRIERQDSRAERSYHLDVNDTSRLTELVAKEEVEVIYHLAGIAFVPQCEKDFRAALEGNVHTTYSVCHAAINQIHPPKVIVISSGEVYGKVSENQLPVTETEPALPQNNYSISKQLSEIVATRLAERFNLSSVIFRPFNHIGAGQDERFVVSNFAKQIAEMKLGHREPVLMVGNLEARRDFTDVKDIVRGYRLGAVKGNGIYNLCSGKAISIRLVVDELISVAGINCDIQLDKERMRPSEVAEIRGNYERARVDLGWEPAIDIKESIRSVYNYWLERLSKA